MGPQDKGLLRYPWIKQGNKLILFKQSTKFQTLKVGASRYVTKLKVFGGLTKTEYHQTAQMLTFFLQFLVKNIELLENFLTFLCAVNKVSHFNRVGRETLGNSTESLQRLAKTE